MPLKKDISRLILRSLALGVIPLTTSACIPIPHFQREAPAISGVIRRNSILVKDVEIGLAVNRKFASDCSGAKQETLTNAEGRFQIQETTQFLPFFVYGDRWDSWSLCFKFPDGAKVVWSDGGWWGGPPLQRLECNFGEALKPSVEPLQIDRQGNENPNDICNLKIQS